MALNREKVFEVAEKLVARGKVDAAVQEYRKLLAETPKDIALLNRVGDLYVRIGKNDEAVRLFLQLAARYAEDGFFVKAIAIYKKILKFDPTRLLVYEKLADLYHKQGLINEARAQYQVLVDYHQKHGDPRAAANVLEKMTELDADDPTPRVRLAEALHHLGDKERELKEYRALADMMMRHGKFDEAGQIFAKAVSASPDDLAFITDAVLGLKDAGQMGAAARLLAIAVERNPQAERIARLAGLGKEGAKTAEPPRVRDTTSSALRVRDVAAAPPELEVRPTAPPGVARGATPPADSEFVVELPLEEPASTEIRPTEEMLRRSPDSPWFEGALSNDVEFELEIESIEEHPVALPAEPEPPVAEPTPEIDWQLEAEPSLELPSLDELPRLDALRPSFEPSAPPVPAPAADEPEAFEVGLDLDELERTSYEVVPEEVPIDRRLGDLLAEAEVFRKYGLREKAHDRVREILGHDPHHFEALALQVALLLDEGKHDRALARAQHLAEVAAGSEAGTAVWTALQQKLTKAGFVFSGERPVAPPAPKKPKKDSVSALLEDLVGLTGPPRKARPARAEPPRPAAASPAPSVAPARPAPPPPAAPARPPATPPSAPPPSRAPLAPPAPVAPMAPMAPMAPPRPAPPPPAGRAPSAPVPPQPAAAAEESLAWLDESPARSATPLSAPLTPGHGPSADEKLFEDEEGFFDLAAELEEELSKEELLASSGSLSRDEPTLEEIVEGFKKGVADSLSAEDYDTHFNLGIAYREMGLIDEAIGEFQLAAKEPKYLIDCCSLLGGCFLEKGLPELAIKWYRRGLETPDLPEEATLGLLYDLGHLYQATGDADKAKKTFVEIYGVNSNYRDVVARLEELG